MARRLFVDTSVWFPSVVVSDADNARAKDLLGQGDLLVTSDHVLIETWLLLNSRGHRDAAEHLWSRIRGGVAHVEHVLPADLEAAWEIGEFPDQNFSIVDRTSFAIMLRLGIRRESHLRGVVQSPKTVA